MFLLYGTGLNRRKEKLKQRRDGWYKNHSFLVFNFPRELEKKKSSLLHSAAAGTKNQSASYSLTAHIPRFSVSGVPETRFSPLFFALKLREQGTAPLTEALDQAV